MNSTPTSLTPHTNITPTRISLFIVVGTYDGKVVFYNTVVEGGIKLKYHMQIECKNGRAKVSEKFTGLEFVKWLADDKVEGHIGLKVNDETGSNGDKDLTVLNRKKGVTQFLKENGKG